jgi:hypothetical protein
MTTITIQISDPAEARLRRQAEAAGKPLEQLVTEVIEAQAASAKTLREISGPAYERFLASGMSEEELTNRLEQEDHASRGIPYDD